MNSDDTREHYYPCIDADPHVFAAATKPPEYDGYPNQIVTFCTRCGKFRNDLDPAYLRYMRERLKAATERMSGSW